ncbi:SWIRM domain-containing protein FUN19 [Yarrowia lipolytica]|nr:SWIRM domain-containing protein FUN19 [Yarrowia lipolytica]
MSTTMMRLTEDSVLLSPPQSPYSREVQLAEKPTSCPRDTNSTNNSDALANALAVTLNSPVLSQNALSSIRDSAEWSERVFATPPPSSEKRAGEDSQLRDVKRPKLMREPSLQQVPRTVPTSAPITLSGNAVTFSSSIFTTIAKDPAGFRRREDAFLDFYQRAPSSSLRSYNNATSAAAALLKKRAATTAAASSRASGRRSDDGGYSSTGSVTRSMTSRAATSSTTRPQRVLPQRVREVANGSSYKARSSSPVPASSPRATPSPKKRVVAPPSSSPAVPSRVHDTDYADLPDYCPSTDSLPTSGRPLKAEWKGAPMDLSDDPMLDKLHPAEVYLASCLRLSCDTYLDSKRRLFAEKVHRLKFGLPFRRTDSQKACRIDVNKASRLFSAYEKVGWLDDELFKKFL